jgi:hypothetical protein
LWPSSLNVVCGRESRATSWFEVSPNRTYDGTGSGVILVGTSKPLRAPREYWTPSLLYGFRIETFAEANFYLSCPQTTIHAPGTRKGKTWKPCRIKRICFRPVQCI